MCTKLRNVVSRNCNKKGEVGDALQHARRKRLGLQHAMTNGIEKVVEEEEEDAVDAFGTSTEEEHALDATR